MNFLYLLVGPSGVGKDSVYERLLRTSVIARLVSHTTRPARPSETSGGKYHFVTPDEFNAMVANDEFIEHATVHGNLYGVNRKSLESQLVMGNIVHIIDYQGAATLQKVLKQHVVVIGLYPPSMEELRKRLSNRGDTDEDTVNRRMEMAVKEISEISSTIADYHVVNDNLEIATYMVQCIINAHQRRRDSVTVELDKESGELSFR